MKRPPPLAHLENSHSPYQDSALECWFLCETFPNYLSEKVGKVPPMLLLYCASLHSQVHDFTLQYPSLNKLTFTVCLPLTTPTVPNLIESKSERMNGLFLFLSPSSVPCTKRTLNIY